MNWTAPDVFIVAASAKDAALAGELAQRSHLPVVDELRATTNAAWLLKVDEQRLSLCRPDGLSVSMDFLSGKATRRAQEANFKSQPLARALGLKKLTEKNNQSPVAYPTVIDATAGLGIDGWMIASLGCSVRLVEASVVLTMMLEHEIGLIQNTSTVAERISVVNANSIDYLNDPESVRADIVYLDPMYPQSRSKALVNKGMQLLHGLIGPDDNGAALLEAAVQKSDYRVVVKRPKGAPRLAGSDAWTGQITEVSSPNTRYDVYHLNAR